MTTIHNLGFPRIGAQRELKRAVEAYWGGQANCRSAGSHRAANCAPSTGSCRRRPACKFVPVGDFAWYDQILEWSTLLGAVPARFGQKDNEPVTLDTLFRMGRGRAPSGKPAAACEMTKWFDTNYHYIVPELVPGQTFRIARESLFEQIQEAQALGHAVKPVIPGPLTWLYLGQGRRLCGWRRPTKASCNCWPRLLPVYQEVFARFAKQGVQWVQIDEPILVLDLPQAWRDAFKQRV